MNYTCAIDTVYSLVESVMLLPEGRVWRDNEDLLLQAAEKIATLYETWLKLNR